MQNAVNVAQGRLPNEVKQTGVTVSKNSGTFVMAIGVTSTDARWDQTYLTNYLENNVVNDLKRINGVSRTCCVFGERKYAMRLWVDPKRLADNGLTAGDVITALQEQNVQVAAGSIGAPPTNGNQPYEYSVHANGRLHDTTEFGEHRPANQPRRRFRARRDVGRVELGAENYSRLAVVQRPRRRRPRRAAAADRQRAAGFASRSARRWTGWRPKFPPGVQLQGRVRHERLRRTSRSRKSS